MRSKIRCLPLIAAFLVAMASVNLIYAPGAVIYVDPVETSASPGDSFTIYVNIDNVIDLYAWEVELTWEPGLLDCSGVVEGPFLAVGGTTFFAKSIDQMAGMAMFGATLVGAVPGVSGDGQLASVSFLVEEAGKCDLAFTMTALVDSMIVDISHSSKDGYFSTPQEANLAGRSAWPEHHHYVVSKDEDEYQTLYAKVKNVGSAPIYAKVVFNVVRDDGWIDVIETDVVYISPGTIVVLSADLGPLVALNKAKYTVEARCLYSLYGTTFAGLGDKIKTFSFAVVP